MARSDANQQSRDNECRISGVDGQSRWPRDNRIDRECGNEPRDECAPPLDLARRRAQQSANDTGDTGNASVEERQNRSAKPNERATDSADHGVNDAQSIVIEASYLAPLSTA
jgi:hypothetical protein